MASVSRQTPKPGKGQLDPRATRYGLIPIWDQSVAARDFYTWTIEANKFFPFRPFIGEIIQDIKGNEIGRTERLPADQVLDIQRITAYFTEFPALADLNSEERAAKVVDVLVNPNECTKYGMEISNGCASCWMAYVHNELPDRIKAELAGDNELQRAANACVPILRAALEKAIGEARRMVDEAIREIDDPTKGKKQFYDIDFLNIYHTHADRPKYKTQTSNTDSAQAIAEAIKSLAQPAAAQVVPQEVLDLIAAQAKELADLKAMISNKGTATEEVPETKKKPKE